VCLSQKFCHFVINLIKYLNIKRKENDGYFMVVNISITIV
jgi:hypothetical protein